MGINWEVVKPSLWTGAGGVVVGMLLLSYGFGYGATPISQGRIRYPHRPTAAPSRPHFGPRKLTIGPVC